jgi:4-diphosphocytidyl-2-C-methyl-D-erythritol kinase
VIRAVHTLAAATGRDPHARLHLRKQIPLAAGLAGGSADAAATLVACDALWGTGLTREDLASVGAGLGSDVPFLVLGGTALGTGRGEAVSPVLAPGHAWHWVVAVADGGLSTPDVYRELDRLREADAAPAPAGQPDAILAALRQRDASVLAKALVDPSLPPPFPSLRRTLVAGVAEGALAGIVSGSPDLCFSAATPHRPTRRGRLEERAPAGPPGRARPVPGARVVRR